MKNIFNLFVIVIVLIAIGSGCSDKRNSWESSGPTKAATPKPEINVQVFFKSEGVEIKNISGEPYENLTVKLNMGSLGSEGEAETGPISPGKKIYLAYSEFSETPDRVKTVYVRRGDAMNNRGSQSFKCPRRFC